MSREEEIRARADAATPGPWMWQLNMDGKSVTLQGGRPTYDLSVMDFVRWGMSGATPRFMDVGSGNGIQILERAEHYATPVAGREHHAHWFQGITNPDATFIEHARADITYLLAENDRLRCALVEASRLETQTSASARERLDGGTDVDERRMELGR